MQNPTDGVKSTNIPPRTVSFSEEKMSEIQKLAEYERAIDADAKIFAEQLYKCIGDYYLKHQGDRPTRIYVNYGKHNLLGSHVLRSGLSLNNGIPYFMGMKVFRVADGHEDFFICGE